MIRWTIWEPDIFYHRTDIYCPVFRPPFKTKPFDNLTYLDHLNTRLVRYSDGYFKAILPCSLTIQFTGFYQAPNGPGSDSDFTRICLQIMPKSKFNKKLFSLSQILKKVWVQWPINYFDNRNKKVPFPQNSSRKISQDLVPEKNITIRQIFLRWKS